MIRSSLESKIYILQGSFPRYQTSPDGRRFPGGPRTRWRLKVAERRWLGGTLLGVALLLVLAILWFRFRAPSFQWDQFFATLQHVDWMWLTLAIFLMLLAYVGRAVRWEVMLRPLGARVGIGRLTSDTVIGYMAAMLLGRVGEPVRPYLISMSAGVPFSSQAAAWFLERLLDLLAILAIFGFAITTIPAHHGTLGPGLKLALASSGYLVALLAVLCPAILVFFRNFSEVAERRLLAALSFLPDKYYSRSKEIIAAFSAGMHSIRSAGSLALLLLYTGIEWLVITWSYVAIFKAFPASHALLITDVVIILAFVSFGSILQIPGIGGGMQVTAVVVLTEIYGLTVESASGIAMFLWVLTWLIVVPTGIACAAFRGWNLARIRQLAFERVPQQEPL